MVTSKWLWRGALLIVIGTAALLRFAGLDWDGYEHYHPDERYVAWVATSIEPPADWRAALAPRRSSLNPYHWPADAASPGIVLPQDQPRDFAYGHLPLYAGVLATRLAERTAPRLLPWLPADGTLARDVLNGAGRPEFDHLTAVARLLTGFVDLATLLVVYVLGRRLYSRPVGVLAAALLAINVMHIQLAHFFIVDPYMTLFVTLSVTCAVAAVQAQAATDGRSRLWLALAALAAGLALGSKFSASLLALPLLLAWWWAGRAGGARRALAMLLLIGGLALAAFALTNPYALLDWQCAARTAAVPLGPLTLPSIEIGNCFFYNVAKQANMVGGSLAFPFTRQYIGTLPYLYFIEMQFRWGMGPLLGIAAFGGLLWVSLHHLRALPWRMLARLRAGGDGAPVVPQAARAAWVVLAWCVPFWLSTGSFEVKFMRYLQPLTPFLMVYAAALLLAIPGRRARPAALALTLGSTALYALAFVQIYATPHPWRSASVWIYTNVARGATIAVEQWGEPLPSSIYLDGQFRSARTVGYRQTTLTWLDGVGARDDRDKLARNAATLAAADYVVVDSNRLYGVIPRLPQLYPTSQGVYPALFSGALGFEVVYVAARAPRLGAWHLKPDYFGWPGLTPPAAVQAYLDAWRGPTLGRVDESFTLYDQSLVFILENRQRLPAATIAQRIEAAAP